jgi:hypothetical protein
LAGMNDFSLRDGRHENEIYTDSVVMSIEKESAAISGSQHVQHTSDSTGAGADVLPQRRSHRPKKAGCRISAA